MEIYLIRHTKPEVGKGVCYGQSDLKLAASFLEEASIIANHLPAETEVVYSSPLMRCRNLAQYLFPEHTIQYHDDLMELNCGNWEMRLYDELPSEEITPWMNDFVNVKIPGGESYTDLYNRVITRFNHILSYEKNGAIVAHGGVLRSILSHITDTPLKESFSVFKLEYGCVVRLKVLGQNISYEILSNIPGHAEQHKPSHY